ncbi:radical SAM protein [Candidatus Woesearchaeota archaeon]|nr:radical SAM protein [Candidatus Woesearchaeota archaeon]
MTTIGLVQINSSFANQSYLPYSVGILQAYAQTHLQHPEQFQFLIPVYKRCPVAQALKELESADAVFFSVYVWNINLSLAIAKAFKVQYPERLVVFGGPQVPDQAQEFLQTHRYVDLTCHNEGEQTFVKVLERCRDRNWSGVSSVSWYSPDGEFHANPLGERLKDPSVIPSPFLRDTFKPLMDAHPEEKWIAIWETNRGCPHFCTFCGWGSAVASKLYQFDLPRLQQEMNWFGTHKIPYIFCADANFGILPRDVEIVQHMATVKTATGYPEGFSVQNTKNATERAYEVQSIIAQAGLQRGVVLSMQSLDPNTLKAIKRTNIRLDAYEELQKRFTQDGIETYSDLILGLPGETYDSFVNGVATLLNHGQHNRIQFNNLSILPDAEMGQKEYQKQYGLQTMQCREINVHGSLIEDPEEIFETSELVVATDSMPRADWVKTRAFCWMTALLHFDKLLQIPIILMKHMTPLSYRQILEAFMHPDSEYPLLQHIRDDLLLKASVLQNGGSEYVPSKQWLNIWWPADEAWFIELSMKGQLHQFYAEAEDLLRWLSPLTGTQEEILEETIALNAGLLKQPFQTQDQTIFCDYNVWETYRSILQGVPRPIIEKAHQLKIDKTTKVWTSWEQWQREVVWWENKKGAYLYKDIQVIDR